jgi:hypothetical protein
MSNKWAAINLYHALSFKATFCVYLMTDNDIPVATVSRDCINAPQLQTRRWGRMHHLGIQFAIRHISYVLFNASRWSVYIFAKHTTVDLYPTSSCHPTFCEYLMIILYIALRNLCEEALSLHNNPDVFTSEGQLSYILLQISTQRSVNI